jgi:hypothetical protein
MELIGLSKVSAQKKVTVVDQVAKYLNLLDGDTLAYLKTDDGDIVIKNRADINI